MYFSEKEKNMSKTWDIEENVGKIWDTSLYLLNKTILFGHFKMIK